MLKKTKLKNTWQHNLGYAVTITVLSVTQKAQPALVFLIPFVTIGILITAWFQGDLYHMWTNQVKHDDQTVTDTTESNVNVDIGTQI